MNNELAEFSLLMLHSHFTSSIMLQATSLTQVAHFQNIYIKMILHCSVPLHNLLYYPEIADKGNLQSIAS